MLGTSSRVRPHFKSSEALTRSHIALNPFIGISMAIPFGLHSFVQTVLVFLISLFFLRLVFWRIWRYRNLPPGPPAWPIVGNLLQFMFSNDAFEGLVKKFHQRYGPIFTIWLGSRPLIIIADREVAHEALIQKGAIFADRPAARGRRKGFSMISSAPYGPIWQNLRRNMLSEAVSPSALKALEWAREWSIDRLVENLRNEAARKGGAVNVLDQFQTALLCILLCMCFGTKPDEETFISVEAALRENYPTAVGLQETSSIPGFLFWRLRARVAAISRRHQEALLPLINKRRNSPPPSGGGAYVDTLLNLTVDGGRSLHDEEIVMLCLEFIKAGTDTTWTSLQWLMANLVMRQDVQTRLYEEIVGISGRGKPAKQDDLQRMPYLEAVVKETLRRHPPAHFVLPHGVTRPCKLAGYDVPTDASVNFYLAGIGMDPGEWQNPSEFRPERFADEGVEPDLMGTKEIKMIPFGAGRRVCPGLGVAMLHLNLIVARLVQEFGWECKAGVTVDLSETQELTTVMKYPLQAVIKERKAAVNTLVEVYEG